MELENAVANEKSAREKRIVLGDLNGIESYVQAISKDIENGKVYGKASMNLIAAALRQLKEAFVYFDL